eukprot:Opistho-2@14329
MGGSNSKLDNEQIRRLQEFTTFSTKKLNQIWCDYRNFIVNELKEDSGTAEKSYELTYDNFKTFITKYFNMDADEVFYKRLFETFDTDKNQRISFKEIVISASILETGSIEDKLDFMFKVYDEDSSGYLETKEINHILDQMLAAASAFGQDSAALRPALSEMVRTLDADGKGKISRDEWIRGGLKNVPILIALGLDQTLYNTQKIQEGTHQWYLKHFNSPAYCNFCDKMLLGLGKQGLACQVCRFTVHESCALEVGRNCRPSYVKREFDSLNMPHHWLAGNFGRSACALCTKQCGGHKGLSGLRCSWCKATVHDECQAEYPKTCDLGEFRRLIIPATGFTLKTSSSTEEPTAKMAEMGLSESPSSKGLAFNSMEMEIHAAPNSCPLVVFINPHSGGRQGVKLLRTFKYLLNPRQVFDLSQGGPIPGLKQFKDVPNFRVLCCGGDGTVGWVLASLDKLQLKPEQLPAVGVLPLGTGNDLARVLGWGGGYAGEDVRKLLLQLQDSEPVMLDRWRMSVTPSNPDIPSDEMPLDIVNNYFSIGVDASVAHKFHMMREKYPHKFKSRARNKLWYLEFSTKDAFAHTCKNLHKTIKLEVDGKEIDLSKGPTLEGLALLNIPSMYGGANLWGNNIDEEHKFFEQSLADKKLEVVGLYSLMHVGLIRGGLAGNAYRIAQCSSVKITTLKTLPFQTDGEPWMQSPCVVEISHMNQMPLLQKTKRPGQDPGSPTTSRASQNSVASIQGSASVDGWSPTDPSPLDNEDGKKL